MRVLRNNNQLFGNNLEQNLILHARSHHIVQQLQRKATILHPFAYLVIIFLDKLQTSSRVGQTEQKFTHGGVANFRGEISKGQFTGQGQFISQFVEHCAVMHHLYSLLYCLQGVRQLEPEISFILSLLQKCHFRHISRKTEIPLKNLTANPFFNIDESLQKTIIECMVRFAFGYEFFEVDIDIEFDHLGCQLPHLLQSGLKLLLLCPENQLIDVAGVCFKGLRKLHLDVNGVFQLLTQQTAKLATECFQCFGHFFELKRRELCLECGKRGIQRFWTLETCGSKRHDLFLESRETDTQRDHHLESHKQFDQRLQLQSIAHHH